MRALARPPDDVTRARMFSAIMAAVAEPEGARVAWRPWSVAGSGLLLAAAALVMAFLNRPIRPEVVVAPRPAPIVPVPIPAPAPPPVDKLLTASGSADALDVPGGARATAERGAQAHVELGGPAPRRVARPRGL